MLSRPARGRKLLSRIGRPASDAPKLRPVRSASRAKATNASAGCQIVGRVACAGEGARADRGTWPRAFVPAALLAGPQPHREAFSKIKAILRWGAAPARRSWRPWTEPSPPSTPQARPGFLRPGRLPFAGPTSLTHAVCRSPAGRGSPRLEPGRGTGEMSFYAVAGSPRGEAGGCRGDGVLAPRLGPLGTSKTALDLVAPGRC